MKLFAGLIATVSASLVHSVHLRKPTCMLKGISAALRAWKWENWVYFKTLALSDEEFAKFKCRSGSFYQYGNADGGHTVTEVNEYASAENGHQGPIQKIVQPEYKSRHLL